MQWANAKVTLFTYFRIPLRKLNSSCSSALSKWVSAGYRTLWAYVKRQAMISGIAWLSCKKQRCKFCCRDFSIDRYSGLCCWLSVWRYMRRLNRKNADQYGTLAHMWYDSVGLVPPFPVPMRWKAILNQKSRFVIEQCIQSENGKQKWIKRPRKPHVQRFSF